MHNADMSPEIFPSLSVVNLASCCPPAWASVNLSVLVSFDDCAGRGGHTIIPGGKKGLRIMEIKYKQIYALLA